MAVLEVPDGSQAERDGFRPNDLILQLDGQPTVTMKDFLAIVGRSGTARSSSSSRGPSAPGDHGRRAPDLARPVPMSGPAAPDGAAPLLPTGYPSRITTIDPVIGPSFDDLLPLQEPQHRPLDQEGRGQGLGGASSWSVAASPRAEQAKKRCSGKWRPM